MKIILSIIIMLTWLSPAIAGSIIFSFDLRGNQCIIANRGDSSAYYPVVFQLARDGQWAQLKPDAQRAEIRPGGTMSAALATPLTAGGRLDIDSLQAVMVRFFDQSGVSFGQAAVLRTPPVTDYKIKAGYTKNSFRLDAPAAKDKISATWVLVPFEEGIAPISGQLQFTHNQPPATRIVWGQNQFAEIKTGASSPAVILAHETPSGFALQIVQDNKAKRFEQRTAWLNMKKPFYIMGLLCGICGIFFTVYPYSPSRIS